MQPRSPFGLPSATCLVIASMIGAGVFTTSGYALGDLGHRSIVLTAWLVGGLIAVTGAISYGRLATRMSESGGEYLFLSRTLHPLVGFLAGWVSLLAGFTGGIAFAAAALQTYALPDSLLAGHWLGQVLRSGGLGVVVLLFFGLLHSLLVRPGLLTQNVVVVGKLGLLAAFLLFAGWQFGQGAWPGMQVSEPAAEFSLFAFASSLVWISLSYSGFNAAVYVAGEVRDATQTVPRAMLLATLLVTGLYVLLNAVFLYAPLPQNVVGVESVAAVAAEALGGPVLIRGEVAIPLVPFLVRVAICFGLLSSVSSMIVAGPRVYAKMADDGVFPQWFRTRVFAAGVGVPRAAIWLQVALASLVVCFTTLRDLLGYLGFMLSLSAAGTAACNFAIRDRSESWLRRTWGWGVPVVYISATLVLALLAATRQPWQFAASVLTIITGLGAYAISRRFGLTSDPPANPPANSGEDPGAA